MKSAKLSREEARGMAFPAGMPHLDGGKLWRYTRGRVEGTLAGERALPCI